MLLTWWQVLKLSFQILSDIAQTSPFPSISAWHVISMICISIIMKVKLKEIKKLYSNKKWDHFHGNKYQNMHVQMSWIKKKKK